MKNTIKGLKGKIRSSYIAKDGKSIIELVVMDTLRCSIDNFRFRRDNTTAQFQPLFLVIVKDETTKKYQLDDDIYSDINFFTQTSQYWDRMFYMDGGLGKERVEFICKDGTEVEMKKARMSANMEWNEAMDLKISQEKVLKIYAMNLTERPIQFIKS